jgi:hypothetical protein
VHAVGREQRGVGRSPGREVRRADLLLALDEELEMAGHLAAHLQERLGGLVERQHARLVVGGTASVEHAVDDRRRPWAVVRPLVERLGRLHVVVRVAEDGLAIRLPRSQVAEHDGRPGSQLVEVGRQAVGPHHVADERGALAQADVLGRDRRLPDEPLQIADALVGVGVDPVVDGLHAHAG